MASMGIMMNSSGSSTRMFASGILFFSRNTASLITSSTGSRDLFTLARPSLILVTVSRFSTMFRSQSASSPICRTISLFS